MKQMTTSLLEILRWRAQEQAHSLAYRFLPDGELEEVCITYEELDRRARSIGALLQASTKTGDRVLLLFPAGLDFITAYFGCLYAKVIAIPIPPPHPARLEKSLTTTLRIIDDAQPTTVLLTSSLLAAIQSKSVVKDHFSRIRLIATDKHLLNSWADKWQQAEIEENDIAFLQYTSGSTTTPKGVMVSHGNLLHNLGFIEKSQKLSSQSKGVFWLPLYHDMGLIGGVLQSLYTGYPLTLIPHLLFLQRPLRWLQAITRFRATTSGGPNFAYDLCVRKIKPEQRDQLDLSTWEVAINGAEPIHHKTLEQFAAYFAPCGFRHEAFVPSYGLAEATLMVTGGSKSRLPVTKNVLKSGLEDDKVIITELSNKDTKTIVSSGQNMGEQIIKIVDVETLSPCLPNQIGEIWISGPYVASGYWNKPSTTASIFGAKLSGLDGVSFLRTGDLGFFNEDELYITGRLKNLIIIDGKNHYPHDIERTVEIAHPAIRPRGCAVFSIEDSGNERIIVIVEVQPKLVTNSSEVTRAIRQAVAEHHELRVYDIKLSLPGSIPRTTSGKTQHFLCKKHYLSKT